MEKNPNDMTIQEVAEYLINRENLRYEAPNVVRLADAYLKENNEKERLTYRIKQLEEKIISLQDINELNKSLIEDFRRYLGYKS